MGHSYDHVETKLVHAGEPRPRIYGAVSIPIFQSAMYEYTGEQSYHDIKYIRLNNTPNHTAVNEKLAALENAEAAMVTASGMAAISTALLSVLSGGDHFLAQECLYGGTFDFVAKDLPALGITFDFIRGNDPSSWEGKLKPNTLEMLKRHINRNCLNADDRLFPTESENISESYRRLRNRLAKKLQDPIFKTIRLYDFRHFKASMEYHKTKDLLHVKALLGHKDLRTTLRYTQLLENLGNDEFHCKTASTIDEATQLIENGFEYVTEIDGTKLFKKRK